tara:strand:- start:342 stop:668 length:327 start_codon:yes stop_codon:yes gene_type:complete
MDKPHVYFFCTDKRLVDSFRRYPNNISIIDEGDEFVVYIEVNKTEDINKFMDYLTEKFHLSGDEIYDLMCHVWGGEGYESLMNHYSEEVTNKILDDSYKYLKDLGFTG